MYYKDQDIERCPHCHRIYIQYDETKDECYCLSKDCGHRWKVDLDFENIKNPYLRASIKRMPA